MSTILASRADALHEVVLALLEQGEVTDPKALTEQLREMGEIR